MSRFSTEASRWRALQLRDPSADGTFVYCVQTTHIYCRPICKARLARRSNIKFHDNCQAAAADGFRPCKRCRPELAHYDPQAELIATACSKIEANAILGKETTLKVLAVAAGLTESHFHRVFKNLVGVTPKTYAKQMTEKDNELASAGSSSESLPPSPNALSTTSSTGLGQGLSSTASPYDSEPANHNQYEMIPGLSDLTSSSAASHSEIEFTIQPWSSGYVLIAAAKNCLHALEVSDSYADLLTTLECRFPVGTLYLSDWSKATAAKSPRNSNKSLFSSIMEALEHPTGKILNLPLNVFRISDG